ncbi:MAG: hypothetical protein ABIY52_12080 [Gemmatimonadaceae bacterium]
MKRVIVLSACLAGATCVSVSPLCGCGPVQPISVVYGVVSRTGAPVAGAPVHFYASMEECVGQTGTPNNGVPTTTDASGRYRSFVAVNALSDTGCVIVTVVDSLAHPVDSVAVQHRPVRFSTVVDSVRIDVALPARP